MVLMRFAATPRLVRKPATDWARCCDKGLLMASVPVLSVWPLTVMVVSVYLANTSATAVSEPVAALVIDYFLLNKPINPLQWAGAALTLFAIYLGSLKPKP